MAIVRSKATDFADYYRSLEKDQERLREFKEFFSIGVSQFFRNPASFQFLKKDLLPDLVSKNPELRIWSAGCSYGAEAYSLAILLDELGVSLVHPILATDVAHMALDRARSGGLYSEEDLRHVDARCRKKYFEKAEGGYRVIDRLREMVEFKTHNLLEDEYTSEFDLILCRNVAIFLVDDMRDELHLRLRLALKPNGVLFLGNSEIIIPARGIGFENLAPSFYRRID